MNFIVWIGSKCNHHLLTYQWKQEPWRKENLINSLCHYHHLWFCLFDLSISNIRSCYNLQIAYDLVPLSSFQIPQIGWRIWRLNQPRLSIWFLMFLLISLLGDTTLSLILSPLLLWNSTVLQSWRFLLGYHIAFSHISASSSTSFSFSATFPLIPHPPPPPLLPQALSPLLLIHLYHTLPPSIPLPPFPPSPTLLPPSPSSTTDSPPLKHLGSILQ